MIDTIIFDVGGVLHVNNNAFIKKDIARTLKLDIRIVEKAWNALIPTYLGKGLIDEKEFWKRFLILTNTKEKLPKESLLSREFIKRFTPNYDVMDIVTSLKMNRYKLGIISDTIVNHASYAKEQGLFDLFKEVVLSYKVGLRKPDPEIFRLALKKFNSKPENSIFIDDNRDYVEASKKLGMKGIVFRNARKLQLDLKKIGIKVDFKPEREMTNIGAHALLITSEGRIILQKRYNLPNTVNPGKISMFGGTIGKNEDLIVGLRREILEELEIDINNYPVKKLGQYKKTIKLDGMDFLIHVFIVRDISPNMLNLHEGEGVVIDEARVLIKNPKLTRVTKLALTDYIKTIGA